MKLCVSVLAVLAIGAIASPIPEPTDAVAKREADPWCTRYGEGCWKEKREPEPEPEPEPVPEPNEAPEKREADPWCTRYGEGCWKDKRGYEHPPPEYGFRRIVRPQAEPEDEQRE